AKELQYTGDAESRHHRRGGARVTEAAHDAEQFLRAVLHEQQTRNDPQCRVPDLLHGPITTITLPGPWTPTASVNSMSAVRLGPVITITLDAAATAAARSRKYSPIEYRKSLRRTTARCTGGSSDADRGRPS